MCNLFSFKPIFETVDRKGRQFPEKSSILALGATKEVLAIGIEKKDKARLKKLANQEGRSMSSMAAYIIRKYREKNG